MPHVELPQVEFKVVVLGDTNTGKTSLVVRFVSGHYQSHDIPREPTIGAFFVTKRMTCVQQNMTCKLLLWDTAGQEQYTKFASTYYQNAAAAIITYDISQPQTIQRLSYWLDELHRTITMTGDRRIVLCVAACKCDVIHISHSNNDTTAGLTDSSATTKQQQQQQLHLQQQQQYQYALDEGKRLSEQYSAIFVNTSAKENMGISFLFEQLCSRVLQYQLEYEMNPTTGTSTNTSGIPMIPVTVVNTAGGGAHHHSSQSPTNKQHQKRFATSPPSNLHRKTTSIQTVSSQRHLVHNSISSSVDVNSTWMKGPLSPTITTNSMTNGKNDNNINTITVSDESDSSHTLPTQDPIITSKTIQQHQQQRNQYTDNDDTIMINDEVHPNQYAKIPSNLRSATTTTSDNNDDRSYHSATTTTQTHHNPCNPICGDNDTVTAFVCGTDRNPSSCVVM